ncbi:hypothetical protein PM082_011620 [Marasmius tenuissimus]|nr:hypothetical protein PM082_011620 [Marasmius tenuissimus]
MAKLTVQIPSTTYTHNQPSSAGPSPLPSSGSAVDVSTSATKSSTYPYSHSPPSPSSESDTDSMLSLEYADVPSSPYARYGASANYHGGYDEQSSSPHKRLAPESTWGHGSGPVQSLQPAPSSNSWAPRANYESSSGALSFAGRVQADGRDDISNLSLPNPHPPPSKFPPSPLSDQTNPLYPRTTSSSSSNSSKSVSSASSNSNASYITSASSTRTADHLKPPSGPRGFPSRTPSPLGERRGKAPSPLSSSAALSSPGNRNLSHRTSSPSPLSSSFFAAGETQAPPVLDSGTARGGHPGTFSSNQAARLPSNHLNEPRGHSDEFSPYNSIGMQRSESPDPIDDTPKANSKIRLVGNGRSHTETLPLPMPSPTRARNPNVFPPVQQPNPQAPAPRSPTYSSAHPYSAGQQATRSDHELSVPQSPPARPNSRNGSRLPVPPTLMAAHHRNSSSTSLVSTMGGYAGGVSGGMAGNRPLSGSFGDLTFGGRSPTSPTSPGFGHGRAGSGSGYFTGSYEANGLGVEQHRTGSSGASWGGYPPSMATGLEHHRTGSSSGHGHRRTPSGGSWVPAAAFEGAGGTGLLPPPSRRASHARSHSYDHIPQPHYQEKEEEDDTIYTGYGGVRRRVPSNSPSSTTTSFPQSRPLPVPVPRHPSRSSTSFVAAPSRPYSAMGYPYAASFAQSEAHLRSQSTGGLSMAAGDPSYFIGAQSTGSATSWVGSQPTGASSIPTSAISDSQLSSPISPSKSKNPVGTKSWVGEEEADQISIRQGQVAVSIQGGRLAYEKRRVQAIW